MSSKTMYFIVDNTHADFDQAKLDAEGAQAAYVHASSHLSFKKCPNCNISEVKVVGGTDDWWDTYALKDSALYLHVFDDTEHEDFKAELAKHNWEHGSPQIIGSPFIGSPKHLGSPG